MGHRLSKIYTRTGDRGDTGLGDGSRVEKDHPRIEAIGTVDELNSAVAQILIHDLPEPVNDSLRQVQNDLFDLGGELSVPERAALDSGYCARLERELEQFNQTLPPLKEFILPGGGAAAVACHLARTVCRRAERRVVTLARNETVRPEVIAYLNRLSDLLFVIARLLTWTAGEDETLWRPGAGTEEG